MSAQRKIEVWSEEDYWAMDEASPIKLEFIGGQIVPRNGETTAMAGSTPGHARICANIIGALHARLRGRACYVTSSDQMVRDDAGDENFYPDVTVVCPPEAFSGSKQLALLNPAALFEVLSTSTAEKDLTTKSDAYFRLTSVDYYLIVSQEQVRVEVRARGENGWEIKVFNRLEDEITLPQLEITLPVAEIYQGLNLPSLSLIR